MSVVVAGGGASDRFVGRILHGTFVVDRPLGEGGMGVVYAAHNAKTPNIRYAIKVLRTESPAAGNSAGELQRFRREAQALAALDHPNIVRPIHVDATEAGEPYLVMEYVPGRSLRAHIEQAYAAREHLGSAFVVAVLDAVADALDHAHARGIVHRDLKPENVVVVDGARSVTAKVLDFGVAKIFQPDGQAADTLTRTSEIAGTVAYMSPEQCRDVREAGAASDRFTLGVMAYELLANARPFDGRNAANTISNILLNPLPAVTAERGDLAPAVDAVLARACDKVPAQRFATAVQFVAALADALGVVPSNAPSRPAPPMRAASEGDRTPISGVDATLPAVRLDDLGAASGGGSSGAGDATHATPPPFALAADLSPTRDSPVEPAPGEGASRASSRRRGATPASDARASARPDDRASAASESGSVPPVTRSRGRRALTIATVLAIVGASAAGAAALVVLFAPRTPGPSAAPAVDRTPARAPPPSTCRGSPRGSTPGLFDDEVCIPAGTFWMGSPEGEGDYDERPRRRVTLGAFYMDRYEVTVARYRACVSAGACTADGLGAEGPYDEHGAYNPRGRRVRESPRCTWTAQPTPGDARPINCISFAQAAAVCRFQGRRLPSEAEWERAARGGDDAPRTYPWGEAQPDCNRASYGAGAGCGLAGPAAVGTARAGGSAEGLLDLAGNVAEWTSDWYSDEYYRHAPDADPPGATLDEARLHGGDAVICRDGCRVTRGGAWSTPATRVAWLRGAHRTADAYVRRGAFLGVRCARTP